MKIGKSPWLLISLLLLFPLGCAEPKSEVTCRYQPPAGQPNPLGKGAKFTIQEERGNTIFSYEASPPAAVADNISLASKRELTFANTDLDTARVILLQNNSYYDRLLGAENKVNFAQINEALTCGGA